VEQGARTKPDVVDFSGLTGLLEINQLIVNGFQQRRFTFFHPDANLFFAEQVGQDFEVGFIRRLRQRPARWCAVLVMACTLPLRSAVSASGISS
jgi:hypothetical protein